ncbi:acetolactate decarboxylase [Sphingobacterium anhuiense]|uniref:acetolactate decarboxylase n=1 Tax=Sphingobacterium anhuiense TaxID=493780 RepID=UPI003C2AB3E4
MKTIKTNVLLIHDLSLNYALMKKYTILILSILISGFNFDVWAQSTETVFHYSVMDAMRHGVYMGDLAVGKLRKKGDFGLGTFNHLDGEMVALDGIYYRVIPTGQVVQAEDDRKVPFAAVAQFTPDMVFEIDGDLTLARMQEEIVKLLPSFNKPFGIQIHGLMAEIQLGGALKLAENDTTGLAKLMETRPVYHVSGISGTLVGFYNPTFMDNIDLTPFHLHFISDDRSVGGHVISGRSGTTKIKVSVDTKVGYELLFPESSPRFQKEWNTGRASQSAY